MTNTGRRKQPSPKVLRPAPWPVGRRRYCLLVLYLSHTNDTSHPRPDLDEFVLQYRRAGGQVDLALFEGEGGRISDQEYHLPSCPTGA